MGSLVNGQWQATKIASEEIKDGKFIRANSQFRQQKISAEKGRYHLLVSYICPWANRTTIFRKLKRLESIIKLHVALPDIKENGWEFLEPQTIDGINHPINYVYEVYLASDANYSGKVSVPVLWDSFNKCIVNNESSEIIRIFNTQFDKLTGNNLDFYPIALREKIDYWNNLIYSNVNNGVYRTGFAKTQDAYNNAVIQLFETLDILEEHLANNRYLTGEYLTEADWRLFVTLIRFDAAYYGAFKCNIKRLIDFPNLYNYTCELYQWPQIANTINFEHIKTGYYSIDSVNPNKIIPLGPELNFNIDHNRARLLGKGIPTKSN